MNEALTPDKEALLSVVKTQEGVILSPEQISTGIEYYSRYRSDDDEALRIGIFDEDLEVAMRSEETTMAICSNKNEEFIPVPLLVPVRNLEWYNEDFLNRLYGENTPMYYYAHPPIDDGQETSELIKSTIKQKLDRGAVVITDKYAGREDISEKLLAPYDINYSAETPALNGHESRVDTYIGEVNFNEVCEVKESESVYEIYQREVREGNLEHNSRNGVSLAEKIEGEEAERLWQIYKGPFDELGKEHPTLAGFDEKMFKEILDNPQVAKIVNKVEGKISTLCMFVQDFDLCPWFNDRYYQEKYPEYHKTENILIFPGIVSDEEMRGNNYSLDVIDLALKLYKERGSNILISFECTEISSEYVPKIVKGAIEASGIAQARGLEAPVSQLEYVAVKRSS